MRLKTTLLTIVAAASLCTTFTSTASVLPPELITNGSFEIGDYGQINTGGRVVQGWSTTGYNWLFNATNAADGVGVPGRYGHLGLWGPGDGSDNGLVASPVGGNFIGNDGAYDVAPISQLVTGLTVGEKYKLSFWWAGGQQFGFTGTTTEQWKVSFGDQHDETIVLNNANHGFTGWQQDSMMFTATDTSQLLSFLANGTPNGEPPFSLLDGVSLTAVPEPGTLALTGLGLGLLTFGSRRRKSK